MDRSAAIFWTLIVYKLVMIAIGIAAERMAKDDSDYFVGGRNLGPGVAALSASASSSSVWTLIGVTGYAYAHGLAALWLFPACVGGFALNWFWLAPALRRAAHEQRAVTVTDLLAGPRPRGGQGQGSRRAVVVVASLIVLVCLVTYVAAQFQGAGKAFAETFELEFSTALLLGAAIVVFYTLLGGFWAVSLTDTLQGLMMAFAALLLPIVALIAVGPGDLWAELSGVEGGVGAALTKGASGAAAIGFVLGLLGIGLGYPGQPHVVNRLMALRDADAVRTGRRIAMAWAVVLYAGMLVLGWSARLLLPELASHEDAFVASTEQLLHPVLAGIMIAALLSAIMSTADSQLLVAAATVSHDLIGGGQSDAGADQKTSSLMRSRLTVLALAAGAVVVALFVDETIFSSVLFAWTAMGSAFGPVLLVTVLYRRPSTGGVLAAMLVGFSLAVIAHWIPSAKGGVLERIVPFVAALTLSWWSARRTEIIAR
ncbi:Na+/solute symporter [Plesiocystis pacifica SIR-1]|uniref:Sodium/proline symporter n=1 Tax=Plesiocystis pacifica SIR-1 TaxID=391625 RepID=A6GDZ8_9BACT|nr:sodium/proline symporter [Plesiocystis pacifica]EDM75864.1 Na+/solute symporter [Plesiocystis pacifica SIR-1]